MPRLLRTFVALRLGETTSRRLAREAERLARIDEGFHVAPGEAFHLTLHFLGDTREEDVMPVSRALEEAAEATPPFDVEYGGLGAFPDARRARVVWAAVRDDPAGAAARLAAAVGERLAPLGFPPEARAWTPHVTLGRVRARPSDALVAAIEAGAATDLGAETLSDLKLILSRSEAGRYHYIDLTTVPLG